MSDNKRLTAKQVADLMGFTTTNLKHYAGLLEQNGLVLFRNTRNHREYTQDDVKLLRAMQYLNKEKSMQLEDAASKVMSSDTNIDALLSQELPQVVATIDSNISVLKQDNDNDIRLFTEIIEGLRDELHARDKLMIDFQTDISNQLQTQNELIEQQSKTIEELSNKLEQMQKQVEQPIKKEGFWSRLFH